MKNFSMCDLAHLLSSNLAALNQNLQSQGNLIMVKVLILVCSMGIAPQDCEQDNAVDVIVGPVAANELACGFHGQAYLAGTALAPTDGNYVKIQCTRAASVDGAPTEVTGDTLAGSPGK